MSNDRIKAETEVGVGDLAAITRTNNALNVSVSDLILIKCSLEELVKLNRLIVERLYEITDERMDENLID